MRRNLSEILAGPAKTTAATNESREQLMRRAISASEAGDKQAAHSLFQQVTQHYPEAIEAWVWLGWTSPDIAASEAAFFRAQQLDPGNQEASLGLRWVASQRAEQPQVAQPPAAEATTITRIAPVSPSSAGSAGGNVSTRSSQLLDADTVLQQAIAATRQGDRAGAYRLFEHVASLHSSDPEVWVWLGGTSPDLDDAERMFTRAYELDPDNQKALLGLRWVVLRRQVQPAPAMAAAAPLDSVPTASEPVPYMATVGAAGEEGEQKEGFFSKFFKRFGKPSGS